MKNRSVWDQLCRLAPPAAVIVCGLILLISPDTASGLVGKILGWGLILGGAGFAVSAVALQGGTAGKVLLALVCLALGTWLLRNPMALAKGLGRFLGLVLAIRGIQDLIRSSYAQAKVLSAAIAGLGLVLILLPMTTSRVVFSLCGAVVLVLGIGMLVNRLRENPSDDDPNIIDAL